ncbi:MAG: type IX secretion system membrane protein PorP/SprF [Bacteroidia bacterium]|nr:type IX secretion system membrane protein PorP/SprF [Bacteroidia bacterium]
MRNLALTLLLVAGVFSISVGQVFVQNTMYNYNRFIYNPAAAGLGQLGMEEGMNLTLLGRAQWLGVEGSPNMSTVAFHSPLQSASSGLGAYIIADQIGPLTTTGVNAAYAYHLDLGKGKTLSIGVNGGFLQKSVSATWIYPDDEDPLVPRGGFQAGTIVPSLGAGVQFGGVARGTKDSYFIGLSGQDLLEPSLEDLLVTQVGEDSNVPRSFFLTAGYSYELSNKSSLEPQVFVRTDGTFPPQVDASLYWRYKPVVFGASYRFFSDSFSAILGVNVLDRTFIAYSYDYTLNSLNSLRDISSHELIISFTFPTNGSQGGRRLDILDNPNDF